MASKSYIRKDPVHYVSQRLALKAYVTAGVPMREKHKDALAEAGQCAARWQTEDYKILAECLCALPRSGTRTNGGGSMDPKTDPESFATEEGVREMYHSAIAMFIHQDQLYWSRINTLLLFQIATIGAAYALSESGKHAFAVTTMVFALLATFILKQMTRKDAIDRDLNRFEVGPDGKRRPGFLHRVNDLYGIRMTGKQILLGRWYYGLLFLLTYALDVTVMFVFGNITIPWVEALKRLGFG
ncbi:MAG: hypothetical protein RLO80_00360 [Hyphomonas sp.]